MWGLLIEWSVEKCQRPKRASFISTWIWKKLWNWLLMSVNALNGLLSFLHDSRAAALCYMNLCVNALNGLLSFLPMTQITGLSCYMCVNALNGLLSFLRKTAGIKRRRTRVCQRPKRASFISTKKIITFRRKISLCQRPKRASFISTCKAVLFCILYVEKCQRPKRASFISTN